MDRALNVSFRSYIEMFDNVSLRLGELGVNIIMMLIIILLPFLFFGINHS